MIREVCHAHAAQNCIKCESPDQEPEIEKSIPKKQLSNQTKIELVKFRGGQYGVRKTDGGEDFLPVFVDFEVWELYMTSGDERAPWNRRGYKGFNSFSMLESKTDATVVLNQIKQKEQKSIDSLSDFGEVVVLKHSSTNQAGGSK